MDALSPLPIQSASLRESARAAFGFGPGKAARPVLGNLGVTMEITANPSVFNMTAWYQPVVPCNIIVLDAEITPIYQADLIETGVVYAPYIPLQGADDMMDGKGAA